MKDVLRQKYGNLFIGMQDGYKFGRLDQLFFSFDYYVILLDQQSNLVAKQINVLYSPFFQHDMPSCKDTFQSGTTDSSRVSFPH